MRKVVIGIFIVILGLISLVSGLANNGLVAHFSFDEIDSQNVKNILDGSSYRLNGATYTPGRVGFGLLFDGIDDYVGNTGTSGRIPNSLINKEKGSIEFWAQPRSVDTPQHIIWTGTSSGDGYGRGQEFHVSIQDDDGRTDSTRGFSFYYGSTDIPVFPFDSDKYTFVRSTTEIPNLWKHVVITWDLSVIGRATRIYVNGVLIDDDFIEGSGLYPTGNWGNNLLIGRAWNEGGSTSNRRYFSGILDEIRIYNRSLTFSEVSGNYNEYIGTNTGSSGGSTDNPPSVDVPLCSDTDGGKNYNIKGNSRYCANQEDETTCTDLFDSCINNVNLMEYYCDGSSRLNEQYNCQYECSNGACIPQSQSGSGGGGGSTSGDIPSCSDTDNGRDYDTRGSIRHCTGSAEDRICSETADVCINNGRTLFEYYCSSNSVLNENHDCQCVEGVCVTSTNEEFVCTDSDFDAVDYKYIEEGSTKTIGDLIIRAGSVNEENLLFEGDLFVRKDTPDSTEYPIHFSTRNERTIINQLEIEEEKYEVHIVSATDNSVLVRVINGKNLFSRGTTRGVVEVNGERVLSEPQQDSCLPLTAELENQRSIKEYYCVNNNLQDLIVDCPGGERCVDGACLRETPIDEIECSNLISRVFEGEDFDVEGILYNSIDGQTVSSEARIRINNRDYEAIVYNAVWESGGENRNYIAFKIIRVNADVDLSAWLDERVSSDVCVLYSFDLTDTEEYPIYICDGDFSSGQEDSQNIIWIAGNIIVSVSVFPAEDELRQDEIDELISDLNRFVDDVQDNRLRGLPPEEFTLTGPVSQIIALGLSECPSEVQIAEDENACSPSWSCKLEPVVCPPHGRQKRICEDSSCDQRREEEILCTSGICSGCFVPRFIGNFDSICIPYGSRFVQEGETTERLVESETEESRFVEEQEANGYRVDVLSETSAMLRIFDEEGNEYEYTLNEGEEIIIELPLFAEDIRELRILARDIAVDQDRGYVDVVIKSFVVEEQENEINAYCDIDGFVKRQKKNTENEIQECQNNYECASNLCSEGECIEVKDEIKRVSAFKSVFVRVICRLAHLFSVQNYNSCVGDYLGLSPASSSIGYSAAPFPEVFR